MNFIKSKVTTTPPLLLGAGILFWGWQTGLWAFAIPMSIILEGHALVKFRWDFHPSDFNRISDLCTLIFLGMLVWLFLSRRTVFVIFKLIEWLPICFFPLMFCQNYSAEEKIDIRAISMFFRRQQKLGWEVPSMTFNLSYPFFALCILCASFANVRNPGFYLGLLFLSGWAILSIHSKRNSPFVCIILLMIAASVGHVSHMGLNKLQQVLEARGMEWFYDLTRQSSDPYQSITAIGQIGELKLSNNIVFRVKPETAVDIPLLLRESSYNKYNLSRWFARYSEFEPVDSFKDGASWNLYKKSESADPQNHKKISISEYLDNGGGMLKLPNGVFQIEDLPVLKMEKNQFGAVRVREGPVFVNYIAGFGLSAGDSPPVEDDLSLPEKEESAVSEIVETLKLKGQPSKQVLKEINLFFLNNFKYSLKLNQDYTPTPLSNFLRNTRAGHCEYFASATVLLLRASGIPARYAVGYSAHEYSNLEDLIIVRSSHAHAWALAYINGNWLNVDNTPSSWQTQEAKQFASWHVLSDLWSWIKYRFSKWQWRKSSGDESLYLLLLLIPLVLVLARRLSLKKRVANVRKFKKENLSLNRIGKDSYFYKIEKSLNRTGYSRSPGETLCNWIKRIEKTESSEIDFLRLYGIIDMHYKYRFDPAGITLEQKNDFKEKVGKWVEENRV